MSNCSLLIYRITIEFLSWVFTVALWACLFAWVLHWSPVLVLLHYAGAFWVFLIPCLSLSPLTGPFAWYSWSQFPCPRHEGQLILSSSFGSCSDHSLVDTYLRDIVPKMLTMPFQEEQIQLPQISWFSSTSAHTLIIHPIP